MSLRNLLDKAHPAELGGLCREVRVNTHGLGRADLVRILDDRLRRHAGQALANLRRGQGPPWDEVVRGLARRMEASPEGTLEAVEERVARAWVRRHWAQLYPDKRLSFWAVLAHGAPTPDGQAPPPRTALVLGREIELGTVAKAAGLSAGGIAMFLLRPLFPLFVAVGLVRAMAPDWEKVAPALVQVALLRQLISHRVTVGFVGSPSAGKDAGIRALFGVDTGNINPVAGSTKEVERRQVPGATALFVINTPGLGDVVESISEETHQVLDHIDVYLYVLNAEGGVQARELADYRWCVATGKPTLVCLNKIDAIRERDRDRYVADARDKLGGERVELVACAFDPLPVLSETPIGVTDIHEWLQTTLASLGKDPTELPWVAEEGPPS